MKRLKQIFILLIAAVMLLSSSFAMVVYADTDSDTIDAAYTGMKSYWSKGTYFQTHDKTAEEFQALIAADLMGQHTKSDENYDEIDYESLSAVELSKSIFTMLLDGKNPDKVKIGNKKLPDYLLTKEGTGDFGVSIYDLPFVQMALYITGRTISQQSIDVYSNEISMDGLIGWDYGTSVCALIVSGVSGKTFTNKDEVAAVVNSADVDDMLDPMTGYGTDVSSVSWYLTWMIFNNKRDAAKQAASALSAVYDSSTELFPGWDPHYSNKDCSRSLGEYKKNKTFLEIMKGKCTSLKKRRSSGPLVSVNKDNPTDIITGLPATGAVSGNWSYEEQSDSWRFFINGEMVKNRWVAAFNPYAAGSRASWFYFDENGLMLTGWQHIKDTDGITRWYYLNAAKDGKLGACYLNTVTPDGYVVDANGAWRDDPDIKAQTSAGSKVESETDSDADDAKTVSEKASDSSTEKSKTNPETAASSKKIEVSVLVDGSIGTSDGDKEFSGSGEVELKKNASAYDALKALAKENGWNVSGSSSYVKGINGLKEKSHGPSSGWMYYVNGESPSKSAGSYKLKDGDSVEWVFVESF